MPKEPSSVQSTQYAFEK